MLTTNAGAVIENAVALDVDPLGLLTVIEAVPGETSRPAGTWAVNRVVPPKVVMRLVVCPLTLHFAIAPLAKLLPLMVRANAALSAGTEAGLRDAVAGAAEREAV